MSREYVGIDLHRRRSVIVRLNEAGKTLSTVSIDNDPVALALEVAKAGPDPEVVLEATYGWYWAADVLEAAGAHVHLAHPLGVVMFSHQRVKNNRRDATNLAELLGWVDSQKRGSPRRSSESSGSWCAIGPSSWRCAPA